VIRARSYSDLILPPYSHSLDAIRYALSDEADAGSGEEIEAEYVELKPVLARSA
jgi:hypothetical protein